MRGHRILVQPFMLTSLSQWIDRNILSLGREMRLSYLPPLMVYVAYGISGLTGIVGTFFVKDYLGLSASFLAALGFWAGIPWALKMPIGHARRPVVALEKLAGGLGCGAACRQSRYHGGADRQSRGDDGDHAGRSLVCAERPRLRRSATSSKMPLRTR